ncbi:hypothetical protein JCM16358_05100 [Halanaerocella petrolearia]
MNKKEQEQILNKAKDFFREKIAQNHIQNTEKLSNLKEFNPNPFLTEYLANFLTGNSNPKSIAKALIYPRTLGTSITTSFGTNIQLFCSNVLDGFGSAISGLDIEFIDQVDSRKKYCQIKAGPNTINKDDIKTILDHFTNIKNLARTNNLQIGLNDLMVGVLYGEEKQLNDHYQKINQEHPVIAGKEFWYRLTGNKEFYKKLIDAFGEVAIEFDSTELLEETITKLAQEIEEKKN